MSWFALVPTAVAFAVVLMTPGALIVRAVGAPTWLALGAGPAVSAAFYGMLSQVFARTGTAWEPAPVAGSIIVVVGIAFGTGALVNRAAGVRRLRSDQAGWVASGESAPEVCWDRRGLSVRTWICVVILLGTVVSVLPIAWGMAGPAAPLQQWDAVFHLNGLALVQESGDASNLNGLYGSGVSVYYPTVWHAMVSLTVSLGGPLTASSMTAAANASTLVIASFGWLLGLAAFARSVFPRHPGRVILAVAVGSAFSMFPTVLLSTLAQWPNGLAVMLIPGAAALVVHSISMQNARVPGATVLGSVLAVLAVLAAVGVALTQPSGIVGLAVVIGPCVGTAWFLWVRGLWRRGHKGGLLWCGGLVAVAVAGVVCVAVQSPIIKMVLAFPRAPQRGYEVSVPRLLLDMVLSPVPGNLVLSAAVLLGAVILLRTRTYRWIVVSAALIVLLSALAAGPENPLRIMTGIWYTQAARIEALYPILAVLLAAVGLEAAGKRLSGWLRRGGIARGLFGGLGRTYAAAALVVLLALVLSAGFQAPQRTTRYAQSYQPGQITWGTMLTGEEIDLMRRLPDIVGPDAVLLGDPFDGSPYAWSIGQTHVVYAQLNVNDLDADQNYLLNHFNEIGTNPRVCEAVRALGVTHYYQDRAGRRQGAKVNPGGAGLRDVDTSVGFDKVAQVGWVKIFAVTACT